MDTARYLVLALLIFSAILQLTRGDCSVTNEITMKESDVIQSPHFGIEKGQSANCVWYLSPPNNTKKYYLKFQIIQLGLTCAGSYNLAVHGGEIPCNMEIKSYSKPHCKIYFDPNMCQSPLQLENICATTTWTTPVPAESIDNFPFPVNVTYISDGNRKSRGGIKGFQAEYEFIECPERATTTTPTTTTASPTTRPTSPKTRPTFPTTRPTSPTTRPTFPTTRPTSPTATTPTTTTTTTTPTTPTTTATKTSTTRTTTSATTKTISKPPTKTRTMTSENPQPVTTRPNFKSTITAGKQTSTEDQTSFEEETTSTAEQRPGNSAVIGAIAGGIGGLLLIAVIIAIFWIRKRKRASRSQRASSFYQSDLDYPFNNNPGQSDARNPESEPLAMETMGVAAANDQSNAAEPRLVTFNSQSVDAVCSAVNRDAGGEKETVQYDKTMVDNVLYDSTN